MTKYTKPLRYNGDYHQENKNEGLAMQTRKIYGYTGYWIRSDGRIVSYKRNSCGVIKTTSPDRKGYFQTVLTLEKNKYKTEYLHRIVWSSFSGRAIPKGMEINHKDGNKSNNNFSNPELVTHKENMIHAHKNGLASNRAAAESRLKIKREWHPMIKCLLLGGYKQREVAELVGTTQENISRIIKLKGKTWNE